MNKYKITGTVFWSFLLIFCFLLSSCAKFPENDYNSTKEKKKMVKIIENEVFNLDNNKSDIQYDVKRKILSSELFRLELKEITKKKDIDGKKSWFIYSEITNLGDEPFFPVDIWNSYLIFSSEKDSLDSLYPNVLPKKDLDGSEFKTAIDNMSKELKPGEKLTVGQFYNLPESDNLYQSILNENMEIIYCSMLTFEVE